MSLENQNSDDSLIKISNLTFRRGDRAIFEDINLTIPRGKVSAIMGPSGTGKTTLLQLISGQLRPDSGSVIVDGLEVPALRRKELYELRKRMGMLFQNGALLTDLTAFENVAFPLREHTKLPEAILRDLILMKLELVGLRGARDLMPDELSGGMRRRVALARAIALDPKIIMYDEPFTGLDPISMGIIVKLLKLLSDTLGLTSIIVTHDVTEVTSIADQIYLLSDGKVVADGSPEILKTATSPWVRQFMDGLDDGPVPFHYPAVDYATDLLEAIKP